MTRTITGYVEAVLIAPDRDSLLAVRQPEVRVTFEGFEGDRHAGLTRPSGSRTSYYPRGVEIRNSRQVSILSEEELAEVAAALGIPQLKPEWLGANLLLSGIPSLTLLPPGTRLHFPQDAALVVAGENSPCTDTGQAIQDQNPTVRGVTTRFPQVAVHKRGIVAWVERPGKIAHGDSVRVEVPDQIVYQFP
jgi:MOSC domain-containing protein YiiM